MTLGFIAAALLLTQSASVEPAADGSEAAYEQLAAGENRDAIARIEAALKETPSDPALLINLGTAYAREGRTNEARDAFRRAIASDDPYRVQLADGSWEDSRKVARLALDSLDRTAFAAK